MAKSLNAAQIASFSSNTYWLWKAVITVGGNSYTIISGHDVKFGHPALLLDISAGRQSINPLDFNSSRDSYRLTVDGDFWASIVSANNMRGARIELSIGTGDLGEGDYMLIFVGAVRDYVTNGLTAELRVEDPRSVLEDVEIDPKRYPNKNPIDIIERIFTEYLDAGDYTSGIFSRFASTTRGRLIAHGYNNAISADPVPNPSAPSELVTPPNATFAIGDAESIRINDYIAALCVQSRSIVVRRSGRLDVIAVSPTDPIRKILKEDECKFQMENAMENMFNRFSVEWLGRMQKRQFNFVGEVAAEVSDVGILEKAIEMPFAQGFGRTIGTTPIAAGATEIVMTSPTDAASGFCGISNNQDYATYQASPPTSATSYATTYQLDATRPAYIMVGYDFALAESRESSVQSVDDLGGLAQTLLNQAPEIYSVVGWAPHVATSATASVDTTWGVTNFRGGQPVYTWALYADIGARGLFGTTDSSWAAYQNLLTSGGRTYRIYTGLHHVDVTAPLEYCQDQLHAFSYGAPIATAYTNGEHIDLEVGDVVGVQSRRLVWRGHQYGSTGTDKWRVIGVKINPFGGNGCCEFTLQYMPETAPAITFSIERQAEVESTKITAGGGGAVIDDPDRFQLTSVLTGTTNSRTPDLFMAANTASTWLLTCTVEQGTSRGLRNFFVDITNNGTTITAVVTNGDSSGTLSGSMTVAVVAVTTTTFYFDYGMSSGSGTFIWDLLARKLSSN